VGSASASERDDRFQRPPQVGVVDIRMPTSSAPLTASITKSTASATSTPFSCGRSAGHAFG
jgi:hypothetical protein